MLKRGSPMSYGGPYAGGSEAFHGCARDRRRCVIRKWRFNRQTPSLSRRSAEDIWVPVVIGSRRRDPSPSSPAARDFCFRGRHRGHWMAGGYRGAEQSDGADRGTAAGAGRGPKRGKLHQTVPRTRLPASVQGAAHGNAPRPVTANNHRSGATTVPRPRLYRRNGATFGRRIRFRADRVTSKSRRRTATRPL